MLVYLHIPFCHRVCPYCSFHKHTPGGTSIGGFIDALLAETRHRLHPQPGLDGQPSAPRTLYLGGGTPSMLSPTHLSRLFEGLSDEIDFDTLDEIAFEANPATFDLEKATLFRHLGIRRVSLGIQSFTPHVLETLGREHDPSQAAESVRILRAAGMPSVNIDLMFSVPGLSHEDWRHTLETAIALDPDHISAYNLTYEEDTGFFESLRRGEMDADEDRDATQFHLAHELLTVAGYEHYETSNYARPGHRSTHNQGYWQGESYLGLGPSAVSTLPGSPETPGREMIRHSNIADTPRYLEMIARIGHAISHSEYLGHDEIRLERIALLLRTSTGLPLHWLAPADPTNLIDQGLAVIRDAHFILTPQGAPLVDAIAAELA
ncbi:MAG: radical SAM family heme chaperone HemW [Akkermansiaceae bacterium]|jgi:oxygen-independent coproporphyrinogen-3 oxidase|nr:radical SAM family heme chaperone HemW [Akkermansiaceae bacterium]